MLKYFALGMIQMSAFFVARIDPVEFALAFYIATSAVSVLMFGIAVIDEGRK